MFGPSGHLCVVELGPDCAVSAFGGEKMSVLLWLSGGLTVFLFVYLLYALFNAEEVA